MAAVFRRFRRRSPSRRGPQLRTLSLRKQDGMLHADDLDDWRHHWREPYPLMLAVPWPAHLRLNARFADIVVDREDSRVLDFSRFHQTVSCGEPSLRPPEAPVPGRE